MPARGSAFGLARPEPIEEFPEEFRAAHPGALPPSVLNGLAVGRTDIAQMLAATAMAGNRALIDAFIEADLPSIPDMDDAVARRVTARVRAILTEIGREGLEVDPRGQLTPGARRRLEVTIGLPGGSDPVQCDIMVLALTELELVDPREGHIVLTPVARVFSKDPFQLAHHIATRLPMSLSEFEHEASLLTMLDMVRMPSLESVRERLEASAGEEALALAEAMHEERLLRLTLWSEGLEWENENAQPVSAEDILGASTPTLSSLVALDIVARPLDDTRDNLLALAVTEEFRIFLAHSLRGGMGFA